MQIIDSDHVTFSSTDAAVREKLFGAGPRLAAPHPGASYRRDARTAASVEEKVTWSRPSAVR
jgi:hypothetical protein